MSKKYIFITLFGFISFIIGYILIYNHLNSTELTITTKNTSSYTVSSDDKELFSATSLDKATIRIPNKSEITIHYTGLKNYDDGQKTISINNSPVSTEINPYFSEDYLESLAKKEVTAVRSAVEQFDSIIPSNYSIENITLHHFGEWAGATLAWKGEYTSSSDTQRVVLKKEDDKWSVVGKPSILLHSPQHPSIPVDVLRNTNDL